MVAGILLAFAEWPAECLEGIGDIENILGLEVAAGTTASQAGRRLDEASAVHMPQLQENSALEFAWGRRLAFDMFEMMDVDTGDALRENGWVVVAVDNMIERLERDERLVHGL